MSSEYAELINRAKVEWQSLFLVSYHGTPSGVWFADLTEADVGEIKNLIRELAAMLALETGTSLDADPASPAGLADDGTPL